MTPARFRRFFGTGSLTAKNCHFSPLGTLLDPVGPLPLFYLSYGWWWCCLSASSTAFHLLFPKPHYYTRAQRLHSNPLSCETCSDIPARNFRVIIRANPPKRPFLVKRALDARIFRENFRGQGTALRFYSLLWARCEWPTPSAHQPQKSKDRCVDLSNTWHACRVLPSDDRRSLVRLIEAVYTVHLS